MFHRIGSRSELILCARECARSKQKLYGPIRWQHQACWKNLTKVLFFCRCGASLAKAGDGALQLGVIVKPVGLQPDVEGLQGDQEIHRLSLEVVFTTLEVCLRRSTLKFKWIQWFPINWCFSSISNLILHRKGPIELLSKLGHFYKIYFKARLSNPLVQRGLLEQ